MRVQPPRVRYYTPYRLRGSLVRTRTPALFDELASHAVDGAMRSRFVGERIWLLTDPALARQALTEPPEVVARSPVYRKISVFLGDSLLTTEGPLHRLRRRQVQPAFTRPRVQSYADSIVTAATTTADSWRPGQVVAMEQEMAALTLDAIGRAVLGVDGRAQAEVIAKTLGTLMYATPLVFLPGFERLATSSLPGFRWISRRLEVLDGIARRAAESSQAELIQTLRSAAEDVPELSVDEVRDELLTLLLAGHETTATTLTWAWGFLDEHPDVAERMRAEVTSVLGSRTPAYADVERLPFTNAVVSETLRLRPAAWIIERQVVGDVRFGHYIPPRGTILLISPWLLHRDPSSWSRPEEFRPDRWLRDGRYDDSAPGQPRGAWMPFGAGAHLCVGAAFAWTEAVLALAVLAPRWRPTLVEGPVRIRAAVTMRPAASVPMRLEPVDLSAASAPTETGRPAGTTTAASVTASLPSPAPPR